MWLETTLTALQVLLAASVSVVPVFYRNHFPYSRNIDKAVEALAFRAPRDVIPINGHPLLLRWVERDEPGFEGLLESIKEIGIPKGETTLTQIQGEVEKIGRAECEDSARMAEYFSFDFGGTVLSHQSILYLQMNDGSHQLLEYRQFTPNQVRELRALRSWANERKRERSYRITSFLAIWFTVTSFGLIYLGF